MIAIIARIGIIACCRCSESLRRRYAKMTQCMTNERSYGTATNSLANENKDLLLAPNWAPRSAGMAFDLPAKSKKGCMRAIWKPPPIRWSGTSAEDRAL